MQELVLVELWMIVNKSQEGVRERVEPRAAKVGADSSREVTFSHVMSLRITSASYSQSQATPTSQLGPESS